MLEPRNDLHSAPAGRYHVSLAVDDSEIHEAQRRRDKVFT